MHTKHSHSFDRNIFIFLCCCFFPLLLTLLVLDLTRSKILVLNLARRATLNRSITLALILQILIKVLKRSKRLRLVRTTTE